MPVLTRLQARSLMRLPRELRDQIYQHVLDTALIEVPEPLKYVGGTMVMRHGYTPPKFFFQTPDLLLVSRQINEEAREFLNKYIVVEMAPIFGGLGFVRLLSGMAKRATRFRQVQQLVVPQDMLQKTLEIAEDGQIWGNHHFGATRNLFRALEVVVWPNGGEHRRSRDEREAAVRICFDKPDLQLIDVEYDVIEHESHEDEGEEFYEEEMLDDDEDPTEFGRHDWEGWVPKHTPYPPLCECKLQTKIPRAGSKRLIVKHPATHGSS